MRVKGAGCRSVAVDRLPTRPVDARHVPPLRHEPCAEREIFIVNLLVRIYSIIVMIRWTGLAPMEFLDNSQVFRQHPVVVFREHPFAHSRAVVRDGSGPSKLRAYDWMFPDSNRGEIQWNRDLDL